MTPLFAEMDHKFGLRIEMHSWWCNTSSTYSDYINNIRGYFSVTWAANVFYNFFFIIYNECLWTFHGALFNTYIYLISSSPWKKHYLPTLFHRYYVRNNKKTLDKSEDKDRTRISRIEIIYLSESVSHLLENLVFFFLVKRRIIARSSKYWLGMRFDIQLLYWSRKFTLHTKQLLFCKQN